MAGRERPQGTLEQMLVCLENIETHLGIIAKNPGLAAPPAGQKAAAPAPAKAEPKAEEPKADAAPTVEDVRAALKELADNLGREAAIGLLKESGYKNASAIPEGKRAEFIAKCRA